MDPDSSPTTALAADDTRDDDGRFRPGVSGDPRSLPQGSRRVPGLARAPAEAGVVAVVVDPRRPARPAAFTRRPRRLAA